MVKKILDNIFSKNAIIAVFSFMGLILLFLFLIGGKFPIFILAFFLFSLAFLEEKTNMMVVRLTSRATLAVIYIILATTLIILPSLYLYYEILIPYHEMKSHNPTIEEVKAELLRRGINPDTPSTNEPETSKNLDDALKKLNESVKDHFNEEQAQENNISQPKNNQDFEKARDNETNRYDDNSNIKQNDDTKQKSSIQFY